MKSWRLKSWLLALLSSVALASAALPGIAYGADMTMPLLKAPPLPTATWSGVYLGIDGGVARQDAFFNDVDNVFSVGTLSTTRAGAVYGGFAGYNWQDRSFVYGVEADINGLSVKTTENWNGDASFMGTALQTQAVPWVATFRGRLGIDVDSTLFYFTGGLALGRVENSFTTFCSINVICISVIPPGGMRVNFSEDTTRVGWTAGAGFEHLFGGHYILRGEYRYVDLGERDGTCTATSLFPTLCDAGLATHRGQFSNALMSGLVGVGYKF